MEDSSAVQMECIDAFSNTDFIMEPGVFNTLKRYFKSGGSPEMVVQLLSDNYMAVAQTANLIAEWLIQAGECNEFSLIGDDVSIPFSL